MKCNLAVKKSVRNSFLVVFAIAVVVLLAVGSWLLICRTSNSGMFTIEGSNYSYDANKESVEKGIIKVTAKKTEDGDIITIYVRYCNNMSFMVQPTKTSTPTMRFSKSKNLGGIEYGFYGGSSTLMACSSGEDERSIKEAEEIFDSLRG